MIVSQKSELTNGLQTLKPCPHKAIGIRKQRSISPELSKPLFKLVEFENTGLALSCPWSSFPQTQIQSDRGIIFFLITLVQCERCTQDECFFPYVIHILFYEMVTFIIFFFNICCLSIICAASSREHCIDFCFLQTFPGNYDRNGIQTRSFDPPFYARFVRLVPRGWRSHISMRLELYGCPWSK